MQTGWCLDLAIEWQVYYGPGRDISSLVDRVGGARGNADFKDWSSCCKSNRMQSPCWEQASTLSFWPKVWTARKLTQMCCFPEQTFCPRWLSFGAFDGLVLHAMAHSNPEVNSWVQDVNAGDAQESDIVTLPTMSMAVMWFCGQDRRERERLASFKCATGMIWPEKDREHARLLCLLRNVSLEAFPQLARGPSARRHHYLAPRAEPAFTHIQAQYSISLV